MARQDRATCSDGLLLQAAWESASAAQAFRICRSRDRYTIHLCLLTDTSVLLGNGLRDGPDTPCGRTVAPPRATAASGTSSCRKQRAHAILSADGVLFACALLHELCDESLPHLC